MESIDLGIQMPITDLVSTKKSPEVGHSVTASVVLQAIVLSPSDYGQCSTQTPLEKMSKTLTDDQSVIMSFGNSV